MVAKSVKKNRPFTRAVFLVKFRLFSFETVTASATFRVAITGIAYVDFAERTIVASAIKLALGDVATDILVDVHTVFHAFTSRFVSIIVSIFRFSIDIFHFFL